MMLQRHSLAVSPSFSPSWGGSCSTQFIGEIRPGGAQEVLPAVTEAARGGQECP